MFKYCVIGIICIIIGLFCYLKPDLVYEITEEWKSYSNGDPSDSYIKRTKNIGISFLIYGVAIIILAILFL